MVHLTDLTKGPKSYATVQCGPGPDDHVLLNSDLSYGMGGVARITVNHSCEPNAAFDVSGPDQAKWHMRTLKRIATGESVTYFYPSTEWLMDQPFDCTCGTPSCLRRIQGAAVLSETELLARGAISPWISDAIRQRDTAERHVRD
ncbi:hypothetical protein BC826DRAFT_257631 [Russula brevipes]|nr:hypothetical protein BC826DRAFT_257631 [Russula brevipes]